MNDRAAVLDTASAAARGRHALARAAGDLRRGLPVALAGGSGLWLVAAAELMAGPLLGTLRSLAGATLIVTAARARTLGVPDKGRTAIGLRIPPGWTADSLRAIGDPSLDMENPLGGPYRENDPGSARAAEAAVALCRVARLLPAAVMAEVGAVGAAAPQVWADDAGLLLVRIDAVLDDATAAAGPGAEMTEVVSAHLPLEGAENARVIAYRPADGGEEHLAIVVGSPNAHDPVLVRLHSACLTGDLLGSLKCDCGDQLRQAIRLIGAEGTGLLLYLAQEGRGIGLIGKLKAYALQDQGFDTVDANLRLGYGVDERIFTPAAEMLKALGLNRIRLLTNNPDKVAAMEARGLEVVERVPHAFPPNPHNAAYLATKRQRTGHLD